MLGLVFFILDTIFSSTSITLSGFLEGFVNLVEPVSPHHFEDGT